MNRSEFFSRAQCPETGGPGLVQANGDTSGISGCFGTSVLSLLATDLPPCGNSCVQDAGSSILVPCLLSGLEEDHDKGAKCALVSASRCVLKRKHLGLRGCDLVSLSLASKMFFSGKNNNKIKCTCHLVPSSRSPRVAQRFVLFKVSW